MEIPVDIISGTIEPDWAQELNTVKVYQFNSFNAECIMDDVPVREMGGLAVWFSKEILTPRDVLTMKQAHSTVDLLLDSDLALATNTKLLLQASRQQRGDDDPLTIALIERSKPNRDLLHGGNENWLFPINSLKLEVVKTSPISTIREFSGS